MVVSQTPVSCAELIRTFPQFFVESLGDTSRKITGVSSPERASPETAVFLATPKALAAGFSSDARVLIVSRKAKTEAEAHRGERTILIATNVELAMAQVISKYFLATPYTNRGVDGISSQAFVAPDAHLSQGVRIGPNAFIGARVKLGSGVYIGAGSIIEDDSEIGDNTVIHPLVFVGHSTIMGQRCEVHPNSTIGKEGYGYAHDEKGNHYRIPHQGRVVFEDDVHIGGGCTIDRATFGETRFKSGIKTDNQIHVAHNNEIGKNALLTKGFTMAGSSKIGANFVAGGGSVVTGHIEVCDNVQLAAMSGVSKSITEPGQYGGLPLVPLSAFIKIKAAMVKLPEMRRQLKEISRKLGLDSPEADA